MQDPRIGFVTITDVETAPDLSIARVWVSVIGQPDERAKTMRALERAMPFVRRELGSRIRLRRIPELHVRADDTAERGTRVLRLLAELESGGARADDAAPDRRVAAHAGRRGFARDAGGGERRIAPPWPPRAGQGPARTARIGPGAASAPASRTIDDASTCGPGSTPCPTRAANAIAAARHALVVCHENPDADTLGAAIGVAAIVERHGGRATLDLDRPRAAAVRLPRRAWTAS